jgi:hypothetical protein
MRPRHFAAVTLALATLAAPLIARAWVVVRAAPVYYAPRPVVVVAPVPVYVAPVPVYVTPAPAYVAPQQVPNVLTTSFPVGTNFMTLPQGCNAMTIYGQAYYQCGVNWMRPFQGPNGTYFSVVPPP